MPTQQLSVSEKSSSLRRAGLWMGARGYFVRAGGQPLPDMVHAILKFMAKPKTNHNRTYMAMYDITSNKVRRLVAKYFEEQGFVRVQKSVYLGNFDTRTYKKISGGIAEMNALYENEDSIIFLPLNDQILAEGRFIGKELDFQLAIKPPSTLVL